MDVLLILSSKLVSDEMKDLYKAMLGLNGIVLVTIC